MIFNILLLSKEFTTCLNDQWLLTLSLGLGNMLIKYSIILKIERITIDTKKFYVFILSKRNPF